MVQAQNGKVNYIENPEKYQKSKVVKKIKSEKTGFVKAIDTFGLGMAALELGAGRMKKEDKIEPKAGIIFYPKIGDQLKRGDLIAEIHCESAKKIDLVSKNLFNVIEFSNTEILRPELIKKILY
jgi:thymidine phosphorylase